ncbi:hypothetical protein IT774_02660 [Salinimonas marina]|uniref:Uncharacterized protein n=1 Tax=Salinimonas marina TaxID=2785918 RepID=A0A7S9HDG9_9ALTE|nr:hypothetical protein [Salinimonas marina]QPG06139.1 hypothetical protein IT774_02660 [Salinimonas marina]
MNFNFTDVPSIGQGTMWDGLSQFCLSHSLTITEVSNYRENGPIRAQLQDGTSLWCQLSGVNELMIHIYAGGQEQLYHMLYCAREWQIKNF